MGSARARSPRSRAGVVQLGGLQGRTAARAPDDQHLAGRQQRWRCGASARRSWNAVADQTAGRRVVELGARENDEVLLATRRPPGPSRKAAGSPCADWRACERLCVWVHRPGCRIVQFRNGHRLIRGRFLRRPAPARKGGASPYADRGRRPSSRSVSTGRSPGRRSRRSQVVCRTQSCPPATSTFPEDRSVAVCVPRGPSSGSRSGSTFGDAGS